MQRGTDSIKSDLEEQTPEKMCGTVPDQRCPSSSQFFWEPAAKGTRSFYCNKSNVTYRQKESTAACARAEIKTGKRLFCPAQGAKKCLRTLKLSNAVQEVRGTRPANPIRAQFYSAPVTRLRKVTHSALLSRP